MFCTSKTIDIKYDSTKDEFMEEYSKIERLLGNNLKKAILLFKVKDIIDIDSWTVDDMNILSKFPHFEYISVNIRFYNKFMRSLIRNLNWIPRNSYLKLKIKDLKINGRKNLYKLDNEFWKLIFEFKTVYMNGEEGTIKFIEKDGEINQHDLESKFLKVLINRNESVISLKELYDLS